VQDFRRVEGKALPVTLLGLGEKISESIGPGSEISYPERRGKRCKVEENAAPPLFQHAILQSKWLTKTEILLDYSGAGNRIVAFVNFSGD
jgi:hypothetical protein